MSEPTQTASPPDRPCPFITFYSFKGGVGRSMAVINVAGIMASRGFRVMVIDMDLEAPGLTFLTNPGPTENPARSLQPGFVDLLLDAIERGPDADLFGLPPADAIGRYSAPYELPEGFRQSPDGSLRIMPAGRIDDDYARRLTRLGLPSLYQAGVGLALIKAFKQVVQDSKLFDYVLVDSRTGFSDESGICTRDLPDCLMVVSGLNKQNVEGTTRFLTALRQATAERKPLEVILSPIPNGEDALVDQRAEQAQSAFQAAWGAPVRTKLQIPYHPQLALTEEPHIFRRRRGYLFEAYNKVERSVVRLFGDTPVAVLELARAALEAKSYATAEAHLRRLDKLADTRQWVGLHLLHPDPDWVADPEAESILRFVIERADTETREYLGRVIGRHAASHRTEPELAAVLFGRALEVVPDDPDTLGSYAIFLIEQQRDFDAAEAMFKRALNADLNHATNLGNYAVFLKGRRRDFEAAEAMFKRALDANPNHANNLCNYAVFLQDHRRDFEAAEAMFKRALDADPNHANNLGNYAVFLQDHRRDFDAAEAMFKRALDADPKHADNVGNYARLCLATHRVNEGIALVDRALSLRGSSESPTALDAELWMYVFCCGSPDRHPHALQQLRSVILIHSITTDDWDFSAVIEQARATHPDASWLPVLADVLGGGRRPTALDDWPAWRAAAPAS
jgi:tetratricopeptide (TPR) repeat protein